jgi:hypothetical protein
MTLWIDVTDLYHWGLGHLTGIQRTSASVLSELVKARRDVELFAYDPSKQILRKVSADSLPSVVCRYIGVVQTIPAVKVRAQSPDLPVPSAQDKRQNQAGAPPARGVALVSETHRSASEIGVSAPEVQVGESGSC